MNNKTIRDIFHTIAGFTFAYWFTNLTGFFNPNNFSSAFERIAFGLFAVTLFTTAIGTFYEIGMNKTTERQVDYKDIIRTAIGGPLAMLSTIYQYNETLNNWLFVTCAIMFSLDIGQEILKKRREK